MATTAGTSLAAELPPDPDSPCKNLRSPVSMTKLPSWHPSQLTLPGPEQARRSAMRGRGQSQTGIRPNFVPVRLP